MTTAYLDTSVAVWLAQGDLTRITPAALDSIRNCTLLLSPMVALELAYLHEINRITLNSQDVLLKLRAELGVEMCDSSFPALITIAANEKWTDDPFDRIIVSHAKANGLSPLISSDEAIRKNYIKTVW
ncbi:MAG TPA: PIN domain-containing protein [Candidatus Acidoferrales bacterium]|nr:PIN domain-containing protein [Candidatus Acidoferrales bacterium]